MEDIFILLGRLDYYISAKILPLWAHALLSILSIISILLFALYFYKFHNKHNLSLKRFAKGFLLLTITIAVVQALFLYDYAWNITGGQLMAYAIYFLSFIVAIYVACGALSRRFKPNK